MIDDIYCYNIQRNRNKLSKMYQTTRLHLRCGMLSNTTTTVYMTITQSIVEKALQSHSATFLVRVIIYHYKVVKSVCHKTFLF